MFFCLVVWFSDRALQLRKGGLWRRAGCHGGRDDDVVDTTMLLPVVSLLGTYVPGTLVLFRFFSSGVALAMVGCEWSVFGGVFFGGAGG